MRPSLLQTFDPARPGFVRRMLRLAAFGALALALFGCLGFFVLAHRVPAVGYWLGVAELESGLPGLAAGTAEGLIERNPGADYRHYRLLATAYRRQGRTEAQLDVFDRAVELFPDNWYAQSHHCWYHTLFDPVPVTPASCERAIDLAPADRGSPFAWRAVIRGRAGDLEGAAEDLRMALKRWEQSGRGGAVVASRRKWLEALEAGQNPFDEAMLEAERERF
jgi:tetratricopeptide (TPR) repeat protein